LLRFASIGSGSEGNALVIEVGTTRVMIDCGFPVREVTARLARLDLAPSDLTAILVTHEHGDHIGGVARLARASGATVYATRGTATFLRGLAPEQVCLIDPHVAFAINDLHVQPFIVPHDAREPCQYVLSDGDVRLGVATDLGASTAHVLAMLSGVDALVLETNHDATMLDIGPYPNSLKKRVGGRYGHLSNAQAHEILKALDQRRLKHVVAAHLSTKNNTEALAAEALASAMGCARDWIGIARQADGFAWRVA
jgi:phosphoribosyl 1,2-cyclic phosphodiesterase